MANIALCQDGERLPPSGGGLGGSGTGSFDCSICTESCDCGTDGGQVCGSDGRSYNNMCTLTCENKWKKPPISKLCDGTCPCGEGTGSLDCSICTDSCDCGKDGGQVCGSDGRSYINECTLICENKWKKPPISKVHNEPC